MSCLFAASLNASAIEYHVCKTLVLAGKSPRICSDHFSSGREIEPLLVPQILLMLRPVMNLDEICRELGQICDMDMAPAGLTPTNVYTLVTSDCGSAQAWDLYTLGVAQTSSLTENDGRENDRCSNSFGMCSGKVEYILIDCASRIVVDQVSNLSCIVPIIIDFGRCFPEAAVSNVWDGQKTGARDLQPQN